MVSRPGLRNRRRDHEAGLPEILLAVAAAHEHGGLLRVEGLPDHAQHGPGNLSLAQAGEEVAGEMGEVGHEAVQELAIGFELGLAPGQASQLLLEGPRLRGHVSDPAPSREQQGEETTAARVSPRRNGARVAMTRGG